MSAQQMALAFQLPYVVTVSKPVQPSQGGVYRAMPLLEKKEFQRC